MGTTFMAMVPGNPVAWDHFYKTARCQRLRKLQLTQHPLCKLCLEPKPGSKRAPRPEAKGKAVGNTAGLAEARRVEALRLDRRVGRDPSKQRLEAVAAFRPPAIALRVEIRRQVVAGKSEAVG
jgi:hypothetical protein